jgi:hypothetical protein
VLPRMNLELWRATPRRPPLQRYGDFCVVRERSSARVECAARCAVVQVCVRREVLYKQHNLSLVRVHKPNQAPGRRLKRLKRADDGAAAPAEAADADAVRAHARGGLGGSRRLFCVCKR